MFNPTRTRAPALAVILLMLAPFAGQTAAQQERLGGTDRDEWQRVPEVFEALGVEPGARIADVGAGGGYFTDRLSVAVGSEGRVYAVDIDERALMRLDEWRAARNRDNVELVLGEVDDPRLPFQSLDGALIVNAYHEMNEYEAMLAGIARALSGGGRLVIVDNPPPEGIESRAEQTDRHEIDIDLVEADLEEAGFSIIERQPAFIELEHDEHTHRHWMLVAERPRAAVQREPLGGTARDEWQRVPEVFAALGVEAGARIADVGAGGGYFTDRLSVAVGPEGRVYAVDVQERVLTRLEEWRTTRDRDNIELILGEADDPRLPYRSLDGALIVNAYHEMDEHEAMLAGVFRALTVGGRLVILDNTPPDSVESRAEQTERHQIGIGLVEADLEDAGFRVVERQPGFIEWSHDSHTHRGWMLAAERPRVTVPPPAGLELDPAVNLEVADFACAFPGVRDDLVERLSPPDSLDAAVGGGRLKVCYSAPSARDRVVMGELVPFDQPWRTGANEATLIHLGFPARIAGVALEPGTYSLYTVPGRETWEVVFNRSIYRAGAPIDEDVRAMDVGRGGVSIEELDRHVETLTFDLRPTGERSAELLLEWETTRVRIPVERS